jgi:hypothetical protein
VAGAIAWTASARAAERSECALDGENWEPPFEVRPDDGEPFTFDWGSAFTLHLRGAAPYVVDVRQPFVFRGYAAAPLAPGVMARALSLHDGVLALEPDAVVQIVEAQGARVVVDLIFDDVMSYRTTIACADVRLSAPWKEKLDLAIRFRPSGARLHVTRQPGDSSPLEFVVRDRQRVEVYVDEQREAYLRVHVPFRYATIEGWVPAAEVEHVPRKEWRVSPSHGYVSEDPAAPRRSHPARLAKGASIYPAPRRHPWATAARELQVWISDRPGPWVEVTSMGPHIWVQRTDVTDGWLER